MSGSINPNTLLQNIKTPLICTQCKSNKKENYIIGLIGDLGEVNIICESCWRKRVRKILRNFKKRMKEKLHKVIDESVEEEFDP